MSKTRGPNSGTNTSFYVIAYDIPEDKRRTKVHKLLKGYGTWTEFSLFECFLTKKDLVSLRFKLEKHLNPQTDRVRIYYLCDNCLDKIETVGLDLPVEETFFLI